MKTKKKIKAHSTYQNVVSVQDLLLMSIFLSLITLQFILLITRI